MCYVCLCVSDFSPGRGSRRPGFADVGLNVLVRYCYHSSGAQFLCWRLSLEKTAKALPTTGEGWPSVLRAYKTPIFAKGQKLTHSHAHEEKHAGQKTPLHYTPCLQWHHPGGRALLQLDQAPTEDYHSYTHTLLGVVEEHVVGPNDPPVKATREDSAAKQLWPNKGRHNAFPLLGLGGKRCSCCVHCVDVDEVELPSPLLAEVQSIVCVICALV